MREREREREREYLTGEGPPMIYGFGVEEYGESSVGLWVFSSSA